MIFHLTALVLARVLPHGGLTFSPRKKGEVPEGCSNSSELIATEQFVFNEAENVKNQTETVAKVKTFLCSSNCGQSLLKDIYYRGYAFKTNPASNQEAIREINEIQCNLAIMSQNSLSILFVLLI